MIEDKIEKLMEECKFTDITGNLPAEDIKRELQRISGYRPHIEEYVIYVKKGKADIYISIKDFVGETNGNKNY